MGMSAELWAAVGTTIATLVFLVIPGVVYAYYVLEYWIADPVSYARVAASVQGGETHTSSAR